MLEEFQSQKALIVGDLMIDKYIFGRVERISPEAPVPVLLAERIERKVGGAGNVVLNVKSLGAHVRVVGRVGDDAEGEFFRDILRKYEIDGRYVFSEGKTIVKTRLVSGNQQLIRVDQEEIAPSSPEMVMQISDELGNILQDITVVILSDYAKGFLTSELTKTIIQAAAEKGIPVIADPKGKSAQKYAGATAITPNSKELLDLTGLTVLPDENGILSQCKSLCEKYNLDEIIYTRSEKGISTIQRDGTKSDYPAIEKEVVDVTGAGDTVVSVLALSLGARFSLSACVKLANLAASVVISKFGAAQISREELERCALNDSIALHEEQDLIGIIKCLKQSGKKIVFTNGCFDLIHAGHISSFVQARSLGDVLVVGVNSDASVSRLKGPTRPIVSLENRMTLLEALECVDFVIPFEEDTPQELIEQIRPDVLVKGKDWEGKEIAGARFVQAYGGQVCFIEMEQGLSTTSIIRKIEKTIVNDKV